MIMHYHYFFLLMHKCLSRIYVIIALFFYFSEHCVLLTLFCRIFCVSFLRSSNFPLLPHKILSSEVFLAGMGKLESNQFQSTKSLCNEFAVTGTFGQEGIISIYTDVTGVVLKNTSNMST